jgi:hypothetical protein
VESWWSGFHVLLDRVKADRTHAFGGVWDKLMREAGVACRDLRGGRVRRLNEAFN